MQTTLKDCRGCGVTPGENHRETCDHAACPDCGEQLTMDFCSHRPGRPAIWHGVDPSDEVARALNWWTTATGIDRPVEHYVRVLHAVALKQVNWNPHTQRYDIGEIDNAEIDRSMARGH